MVLLPVFVIQIALPSGPGDRAFSGGWRSARLIIFDECRELRFGAIRESISGFYWRLLYYRRRRYISCALAANRSSQETG